MNVRRIFGAVPPYSEGHLFESRQMLATACLHRPLRAGVSGSEKVGADSIVLTGDHEEVEDYGDVIVYPGHGPRDPVTNRQIVDQELRGWNLALARNSLTGLPVRVIRGHTHRSRFSPQSGYRYDGLYRVERFWRGRGRTGYVVWRFLLVKIAETALPFTVQLEIPLIFDEGQAVEGGVPRTPGSVQRIVRDSDGAKAVKQLYRYRCQICAMRLETAAGPYIEVTHIRPLGEPHNGPDSPENMLCLCPNHRILFDHGAFAIEDDLTLIGLPGSLQMSAGHEIDPAQLHYHRRHFYTGC